jgi:hypothetical protein
VREVAINVFLFLALFLQPFFLAYFLLYNSYQALLIALSARVVRRRVAGHFVEDLDLIDQSHYTKPSLRGGDRQRWLQ